jgi:hypothetical protein
MIPVEIKFHSAPHGLCDLVDGRTSFRDFRKLMLSRWYDRTVADGSRRGVARLVSRELVEDALDALRDELEVDRWHAAAAFVHRMLDPMAVAAGASGWVEMTPTNIVKAESLVRIFPDAKVVHVVRDGRDVACSVASQFWGPNDLDQALDWWARRLELGLAASERLPADRVLLVRMEELIAGDREREYDRLLAFLGIDDDPVMRQYFDTSVVPDRAHIGRWTEQVPPERRVAFEAHHAALVEGMRSRGRLVPSPGPAATEGQAGR